MSLAALGRRLLERMGTGPTELDEFELERVLAYVSTLEQYIQECDWLARRYAEGRRTYATGQYNDAKRAVLATGLELELDPLRVPPGREMAAVRDSVACRQKSTPRASRSSG